MKVSIKGSLKEIEAFLQGRNDSLEATRFPISHVNQNAETNLIESDVPVPPVELQEPKIEDFANIEDWFLQRFTAKLKEFDVDVRQNEELERYDFGEVYSLYLDKENKTFIINETEYIPSSKLACVYNLPIPKTESQFDALMYFLGYQK